MKEFIRVFRAGRFLLHARTCIELLRVSLVKNNSVVPVEKILILGYGRSGSTLLAKILTLDGYHDLGEPLRVRSIYRSQFLYKKRASDQVNAFASRAIASGHTGVVAHLKPRHSLMWGDHWVDCVRQLSKSGWKVVGLKRDFPSYWFSECRARARGTWIGDEGGKDGDWLEHHNWAVYGGQCIEYILFLRELGKCALDGLLVDMVDYELDLENELKQSGVIHRLQGKGLNCSLDNLPVKHKKTEREMSELSQKVLVAMHDLCKAQMDVLAAGVDLDMPIKKK